MNIQCHADELRRSHDEALVQQEREEEEKRAALDRELVQYRAIHQRVEESRDADLKCDLKGAFTFSTPEADLGPASMQVFQVGHVHHHGNGTECVSECLNELF